MHLKTPLLVLLAVVLLVTTAPLARAQGGNPAVTDEGNNVYLVDATKGTIPNLLPAEEVKKIRDLLLIPPGTTYTVLSTVSPDDQTVLVNAGAPVAFLDIASGALVPLEAPAGVFAISNYFWLDSDSLGQYVIDEQLSAYLIVSDRHSGASEAVAADVSSGYPVFVSPNGRRVLYATLPPATASNGASFVVDLGKGASPGVQVAPKAVGPRAGTRARAIYDFAQMFDPLSNASSVVIEEASSFFVRDTATGQTRAVATVEPGTSVGYAAFSQDGSMFALTVDRWPTRTRGRYDGALLSEIGYRDVTGNLPPAENPFLSNNQLLTLDFGSGQVQTLKAADGDGGVYSDVSWSSDSQTLLARVELPGRVTGRRYPQYTRQFRSGSQIRFYNRDLQEIRRLEQIELSDIDLRASFISPDEVLIESHYQLDKRPYYYNLRSGELRNLADRAGSYQTIVATQRSRELVFAFNSFTVTPDFYRMKWDGSTFTRLTWTTAAANALSNTKQQPVSFTLRNGTTHTGVLIMPADAPFPPQNLPIITWQEGGPTNHIVNQWVALVESPFGLLPNFGFGVLVVPLYGRYGIGPERFDALADGTNYGQIDIDAQAEIVAQMRARGWASKVGIVGCSYGGYFTSQSVTRHPTTYDAAHTQCSLVDLFAEWSRGYPTLAPWFQGLPPQTALEEYRRDSPTYNADRIRTPLLAFHGTADFLPVTVMENFMLKVINNQVPAKLLKFQDAGHGINSGLNPAITALPYEIYGAQEQLIWFRTYLMTP